MTRSAQESPVPETGPPGLRWRGLETAYGEPTRARSWKRRIQPRGAYGALRQSSTLLKTAKRSGSRSRRRYCCGQSWREDDDSEINRAGAAPRRPPYQLQPDVLAERRCDACEVRCRSSRVPGEWRGRRRQTGLSRRARANFSRLHEHTRMVPRGMEKLGSSGASLSRVRGFPLAADRG